METFGGIALIHLDGLTPPGVAALRNNLAEALRLLRDSEEKGGPSFAHANLHGVVAAKPKDPSADPPRLRGLRL